MKSKTEKMVRAFVNVDPEWSPMVVKTENGYDVVCFRVRHGQKEYGHVLGAFKYEKNAGKSVIAALEARNKMLARAYP